MTDFEKVKGYYSVFDEKNRLARDNSGRLEYEMTMQILKKGIGHRRWCRGVCISFGKGRISGVFGRFVRTVDRAGKRAKDCRKCEKYDVH